MFHKWMNKSNVGNSKILEMFHKWMNESNVRNSKISEMFHKWMNKPDVENSEILQIFYKWMNEFNARNSKTFRKWIDESKAIPIRLIETTKRFLDLQQYVYLPKFPLTSPPKITVNPRENQWQSNNIIPINPILSLSTIILKEYGLPIDMKLIPSQCIQLWDIMNRHMGDNLANGFNELDPDVYFRDIGYISKDDADKYEQALMQAFTKYAKDKSLNGIIKSTIEELETDHNKVLETITNGSDIYGDEFLKEGIVPLLCELSAQDKLPAILFCFERKRCIELAFHILEQLMLAKEDKIRADGLEYKVKERSKITKKTHKKTHEKESRRKQDLKTEDDIVQSEIPDFTFVNRKYQVTSEEFKKIIESCQNSNPTLLQALDKGIGVYHAGLPKEYLNAVEILFRRHHLRVVIATSSLASGMNMPCKTVVFIGDSIFLNALQYRQMSGRAGRRGFDPIGHVIFFGIPLTKIKRLLTSKLPSLSGQSSLTTTLILRSFNFLNQCKAKNAPNYNFAEKAIKGLFSKSFFCFGKKYLSEQIKYHIRFSIEYLMREILIDDKDNSINLSAMISHLYYAEPSNYVFTVLFKHRVFHRICSKLEKNSLKKEVKNELILILSHLFNKFKLPKSGTLQKHPKYPSKVNLPSLPKDVNSILEKYNERVLNVYTDYVVTFAENNYSKLGSDNILPLSLITIPTKSIDQNLLKEDPIISKLESIAISFVARSPFIAMSSSLGDTFANLEDLTSHIHSRIFLDLHSIPFIKIDKNINAYILDFFTHGQVNALVEANGLRNREVWQNLGDFRWILSTIVSALKTRVEELNKNLELEKKLIEEEKLVYEGFEMILNHFMEKFQKINNSKINTNKKKEKQGFSS
ncbi:hypothetical protein C1645_715601, partial [Glomus cerebriforme]